MNFKRYQFLRATAIEKLKATTTHEGIIPAEAEDSLMLAYIGDAVYSLYIRERMTEAGITKVQVLHKSPSCLGNDGIFDRDGKTSSQTGSQQ